MCDVEWFAVGFYAPTHSPDQKLAAAVMQHRLQQAADDLAATHGVAVTFHKVTKGVRRSRLGPWAGLLQDWRELMAD